MSWIENTVARIPKWSAYMLLSLSLAVFILYFAWVVMR